MTTTAKNRYIRTDEPDFDTATAIAVERSGLSLSRFVRVRTIRKRIIAQPTRITDKSGRRVFGAERKHPRTDGWRVIREFVFAR